MDGVKLETLCQVRDVLEQHSFSGINRKIQLKPLSWAPAPMGSGRQEDVIEAQVVVKWGGELTEAGKAQAMEAGHRFRETMYPGETSGLLRLHSTFRHGKRTRLYSI